VPGTGTVSTSTLAHARPLDQDGAVLGGAHLDPQTHTITHDGSRPSTVTLPTVDWT
jgi:hypothetical protein